MNRGRLWEPVKGRGVVGDSGGKVCEGGLIQRVRKVCEEIKDEVKGGNLRGFLDRQVIRARMSAAPNAFSDFNRGYGE